MIQSVTSGVLVIVWRDSLLQWFCVIVLVMARVTGGTASQNENILLCNHLNIFTKKAVGFFVCLFWFGFIFGFFETGFLYVTMTVLEFTL